MTRTNESRSALRTLMSSSSAGGFVLIAAAVLALGVANSALAPGYFALLDAELGGLSVLHWINDALMALFFLLVGLEIKRELLDGQLASWPRRVLPGAAAAAGMAVPTLIYVAINRNSPGTLGGWAIPAATDIAFALGVLALLGSRVPVSLKILLTAVAVLDDLGAILIIALAYTAGLKLVPLAAALAGIAVLMLLARRGVTALWPWLVIGAGVWVGVFLSGVHATLAGVAVALTVPIRATPGAPEAADSPLHRLEHGLQPWVAFLVVPLFGFANAGVSFAGIDAATATGPVPLGIAAGLFLGKQVGIFGAVWAMVRLRWADMPAEANWRQIYGVALLCGIGFTMSLFIGGLAFGEGTGLGDAVKVGVLGGSLLSALAGFAVLRLSASPRRR